MANITTQTYQIYHINHDTGDVSLQDTSQQAGDIEDYLIALLEEVYANEKSQEFNFVSDTEEVPACVDNILEREDDWQNNSGLNIANRLHRIEEQAQERIKAISSINKGSLLLIDAYKGDQRVFVITKVHHDKYLDDEDFAFQFGLPVSKNRLQKSCVIELNSDNTFARIRVSDNSNKIAKYWWQDFLAMEPVSSAAVNTKNAYTEIVNVISKRVKKLSNEDYWLIRNEVNSYFANNEGFVLGDLCDRLGSFKAETEAVKESLSSVVEEIRELPSKLSDKKSFDTQFDIDTINIKSKLRRRVLLSDKIELIINGAVDGMRNVIKTGDDKKGLGKYVKIYSESGYAAFSDIDEEAGNERDD